MYVSHAALLASNSWQPTQSKDATLGSVVSCLFIIIILCALYNYLLLLIIVMMMANN